LSTRVPREVIDDIRERTDLVELVQRHVRLQRKGNSYVGLCPFHQEKGPSFHVIPHKHLYHCFGCQAGGDCFRFLMEIEGVSFMEAVRELASAAGVTWEERELSEEERQRLKQRAGLYEVHEAASRLWERALLVSKEGEAAREYLKSRGLTKETVRAWRIGYAPAGWTTTSDRLLREGYPGPLLAEAGLIKPRQNGPGFYDTFRDRITIPICDERGRVIAFGARLMSGEGPKYLNSPATDLYNKGRVLFGLDHARAAIQRQDLALLVEGYFDVISLHQAGFAQAIATCGTAMTEDHLTTLKRLTTKIVALFDADEAGARAAERVLPLFVRTGVQPYRLEIPGAKDPDELVREHGPAAMEQALAGRLDLLTWVVERRFLRIAKEGNSSVARDQLIGELVDLLAWTDGTDIVAKAAARLKIPAETLIERVDRAKATRTVPSVPRIDPLERAVTDDPGRTWKATRDIVHLVWLLVHHPGKTSALALPFSPWLWSDQGPAAPVIDRLAAGASVASILQDVEDTTVAKTLQGIASRADLYNEEQAAAGVAQVLHRLVTTRLDADIATCADAAQQALREGDLDRQEAATRTQSALRNVRKGLEAAIRGSRIEEWSRLAASWSPLD
jgi:DNA primase